MNTAALPSFELGEHETTFSKKERGLHDGSTLENPSQGASRVTLEDSVMYIQYVGFDTATGSRTYTFHVIDAAREARDFTVRVEAEAFRPDSLGLQDGPCICYARLVKELGAQTSESRAAASLSIGEGDIKDYLELHNPKKPQAKKKVERVEPLADRPEGLWGRR